MPLLKDPVSKINSILLLPDPKVALTMKDGYQYPSLYEPTSFLTQRVKAGIFSVSIELKKVKITQIDLSGVKGNNYWSLSNNGSMPLINGKYKVDEKLGGKKVATSSDGFIMFPNETINITTGWKLSWLDIAMIILAALSGRRVKFQNYGTVSALGLNQNINKTNSVPISR